MHKRQRGWLPSLRKLTHGRRVYSKVRKIKSAFPEGQHTEERKPKPVKATTQKEERNKEAKKETKKIRPLETKERKTKRRRGNWRVARATRGSALILGVVTMHHSGYGRTFKAGPRPLQGTPRRSRRARVPFLRSLRTPLK